MQDSTTNSFRLLLLPGRASRFAEQQDSSRSLCRTLCPGVRWRPQSRSSHSCNSKSCHHPLLLSHCRQQQVQQLRQLQQLPLAVYRLHLMMVPLLQLC